MNKLVLIAPLLLTVINAHASLTNGVFDETCQFDVAQNYTNYDPHCDGGGVNPRNISCSVEVGTFTVRIQVDLQSDTCQLTYGLGRVHQYADPTETTDCTVTGKDLSEPSDFPGFTVTGYDSKISISGGTFGSDSTHQKEFLYDVDYQDFAGNLDIAQFSTDPVQNNLGGFTHCFPTP